MNKGETKHPGALSLLVRVNLLQSFRRLLNVGESSRLLSAVILVFIIGYFAISFGLFYKGLKFIGRFPGLDVLLTERLLFLLFAFLFFLLVFSNLIISYTNLFRNKETNYLLVLPIKREVLFRWKLIESTILASWAFLFLVSPLLAAYGITNQAPWHFYLAIVVLITIFLALPSFFGAFIAINLARFMDRRVFQVTLLLLGTLFLFGIATWAKPEPMTDEMLETRVLKVLDKMLSRTKFAEFPALPSYWLSSSLLRYTEGAFVQSAFFALVLLSNVLFFGFIAMTQLGGMFYDASSAVHSRGSVFGRWKWFGGKSPDRRSMVSKIGFTEKLLMLLPAMGADVRAILVKDIRVFWRDTTQWGQTLVLFGLLGAYIMNLRHFSQQLTNPFWIDLVSYLNLGACSLNLATLTTRFVYPQFSLEGKRVWIIGLAPLGLARVVSIKFWLATIASLSVTLGLVALSCHMLQLPFERTAFFWVAVTLMTFTLNGLAIGLGVLYPNFKEENPSKIVSGFGGTFCLVLSFLYILGSVALLAMGSPWAKSGTQSLAVIALCWAGFIGLSAAVGYLPFKVAKARLKHFEL
ncbi:MAG: putative ABC transporter permease subunit [Verrucomicrobiales bacterium]